MSQCTRPRECIQATALQNSDQGRWTVDSARVGQAASALTSDGRSEWPLRLQGQRLPEIRQRWIPLTPPDTRLGQCRPVYPPFVVCGCIRRREGAVAVVDWVRKGECVQQQLESIVRRCGLSGRTIGCASSCHWCFYTRTSMKYHTIHVVLRRDQLEGTTRK